MNEVLHLKHSTRPWGKGKGKKISIYIVTERQSNHKRLLNTENKLRVEGSGGAVGGYLLLSLNKVLLTLYSTGQLICPAFVPFTFYTLVTATCLLLPGPSCPSPSTPDILCVFQNLDHVPSPPEEAFPEPQGKPLLP